MPGTKFIRLFWISAVVTAALLLLALNRAWNPGKEGLPPLPAYPVPGDTFIWQYFKSGNPTHALYYFGLFGFGQRIHESDILLVGTSHMAYGLSAEMISEALSKEQGRKVRVFNIGMGHSEQLGFIMDVLRSNHTTGSLLVVDLYASQDNGKPGRSSLAKEVLTYSRLKACLSIGKIYADFTRDWMMDSFLPCIRIAGAPPGQMLIPERFLSSFCVAKVSTGDPVEYWKPEEGNIFSENTLPRPAVSKAKNTGIVITAPTLAKLLDYRPSGVLFTLIPCWGSETAIPPKNALPYIVPPSQGVTFFDRAHLSKRGRAVNTQHFIEALKSSDFLKSLATPKPQAP